MPTWNSSHIVRNPQRNIIRLALTSTGFFVVVFQPIVFVQSHYSQQPQFHQQKAVLKKTTLKPTERYLRWDKVQSLVGNLPGNMVEHLAAEEPDIYSGDCVKIILDFNL